MVCEHADPYLVLGVSPTATQAEITHAYRTRRPSPWHPPHAALANRRERPPAHPGGLRPAPWPRPPRRLRPRNPSRRDARAPPPTTVGTGWPSRCRPRSDPHHLPNHQSRCSPGLIAAIASRPSAPAPV